MYVPEISSGAKPHIPPRNESRRDWWVEEGTTHGRGATVRMEEIRMGTAFTSKGAWESQKYSTCSPPFLSFSLSFFPLVEINK